jgi:hypothetical protein
LWLLKKQTKNSSTIRKFCLSVCLHVVAALFMESLHLSSTLSFLLNIAQIEEKAINLSDFQENQTKFSGLHLI